MTSKPWFWVSVDMLLLALCTALYYDLGNFTDYLCILLAIPTALVITLVAMYVTFQVEAKL